MALWVRFVQRNALSGLVWVGIAGTILGLGLVGQVWAGFALDGVGFVLGLLAAVTMAARFLLTEKGFDRHDPLVLAAWGSTVSAGALLLTGLVQAFPMAVLTQTVNLHGTDVPVTVLVGWVGLVGTAGGVLLAVAAQRLLAPTSASLVLTLEVVAGAGLAYLILGEAPTGLQVVGGAVMLTGVAVAQVAIARRPVKRTGRPPDLLADVSACGHDGSSDALVVSAVDGPRPHNHRQASDVVATADGRR